MLTVIVTSPPAVSLLKVLTKTVCGTFQLSGVKVILLGEIELTAPLVVVSGMVTGPVGG